MTYANAEKLIKDTNDTNSSDDLLKVLSALNNPEKKVKIIKVYGSSGKTEICAALSKILNTSGYKTGSLTTPFIHSITDSITIEGRSISSETFISSASAVHDAVCRIRKENGSNLTLTGQSFLFAVTLLTFAECKCDCAVIEIPNANSSHTAFGSPFINVISSTDSTDVARKVCAKLDRTTKEIVSAWQEHEIYKIISSKCAELNTRLSMPLKNSFDIVDSTLKRMDFIYKSKPFSANVGAYYQLYNILTVIEAVAALNRCGLNISDKNIGKAISQSRNPLCFEVISIMPTIIIDRANTKQRRAALFETLKELCGKIISNPEVICDNDATAVANELSKSDIVCRTSEVAPKDLKKSFKLRLCNLDQNASLIVIGSSEYCEAASNIIKDLLM